MSHIPFGSAIQLAILTMLLVAVAAPRWGTTAAHHRTLAHKAAQRRVPSLRLHPGHARHTASRDMK